MVEAEGFYFSLHLKLNSGAERGNQELLFMEVTCGFLIKIRIRRKPETLCCSLKQLLLGFKESSNSALNPTNQSVCSWCQVGTFAKAVEEGLLLSWKTSGFQSSMWPSQTEIRTGLGTHTLLFQLPCSFHMPTDALAPHLCLFCI